MMLFTFFVMQICTDSCSFSEICNENGKCGKYIPFYVESVFLLRKYFLGLIFVFNMCGFRQ